MANKRSIAAIIPSEFTVTSSARIATLWSNYGHIHRVHVEPNNGPTSRSSPSSSSSLTLILKSIHPPSLSSDPSESHVRKLLSYNVERWFYHHYSHLLPHQVKVAKVYTSNADDDGNLLLEDLSIGYAFPASGSLGKEATMCVLKWLAGFHGTFFRVHHRPPQDGVALRLVPAPKEWKGDERVEGVWKRGCYWYLDTRREELEDMDKEEYAWLLPWVEKVNNAIESEIEKSGTLLHGDVKGANIVFNRDPYSHRRRAQLNTDPGSLPPLQCALYDFQYVGLGLGVLDLIYFLGTSVESALLSKNEAELLRFYYSSLSEVVVSEEIQIQTYEEFLRQWDLAVVDWYRFMAGWGFWGNDEWVEKRAKSVVAKWNEGSPMV
ncbi:Ecdysteroid kinase-domain-containing protein [Cristinia sonorae]|uniref:Ecdysteroid kinase-domain-containing protein n=1 Tax=Cristinia sonorae TaxID=1940300 RepID=A0A8K0XP33_9AGAR|nr:Ecdysteroid kinase-domain-containing protein [Cristinia sonorae]